MPSTHLSLHYHIVFSTKERRALIRDPARVHAYLGGVVRSLDGVPLEIGGVKDHVHLLVGLNATHRVADVLRSIKGESSRWIHEELGERMFGWQEGYSAFTVSRSLLPTVRRYVQRQERHHRTRSFADEYRELLEKHEIEFDERYLW
jgi:putative transposase